MTPQGTLTVADLATTGPIAGLGLLPGDTLVSLNGQPVTNERQFLQLLLTDKLRNQPLNLVVNRSGANQVLAVTPANLLQGIVQVDPLFQTGVVLDANDSNRLVVQRVFPRTPAYYAGLRTGDVITSVAGQRVGVPADLMRLWTANNVGLPVQVIRAGQSRGLLFTGNGMFGSQAIAPTGTTLGNQAGITGTAATGATTATLNAGPAANPTAAAPAAGSGALLPGAAGSTVPPAPGSTQRVPVTIPGATNPPAGNPLFREPSPPGAAPSTTPVPNGA